jgi:hypothetical protein
MPARKTLGNGEAFWARVQKTETCWLWTGAKTSLGYGRVAYGGKEFGDYVLDTPITGDI